MGSPSRVKERATMSSKVLILIAVLCAVGNAAAEFHRCQCCEDNPPEQCDRLRQQIPCDDEGFQAMCARQTQRTRRNTACPMIWRPVCGTDGVTYASACMADGKDIECQGECPCEPAFSPCQCCEDDPPAKCATIRMVLPCDNARFQHSCANQRRNKRSNFACPLHYAPVCGTNGQTYSNRCMAGDQVCIKQNGERALFKITRTACTKCKHNNNFR